MEIVQARGPHNVGIVFKKRDDFYNSRRKMNEKNLRFVLSWMKRLWSSKGSKHHSMRNFMRLQWRVKKFLHQLGMHKVLLHLWTMLLRNNIRITPTNHQVILMEGQLELIAKRVRWMWVLGAPMELKHLLLVWIVPLFRKFFQQDWMNQKVLLMVHNNYYQALVWVLISVKGCGKRNVSRSLKWSKRKNGNNWLNKVVQCLHPTQRNFNDLIVI